MKTNSLLDILKIAASNPIKMFAISPRLLSLRGSQISSPLLKILSLSMGRISGLRNRVIVVQRFFSLVLSMKKQHGSDFTIKWLKSCYVAIQKAQAGDNLPSLRALEPGLPMPRLINGLPAFIKSQDRSAIKRGEVSIIRFWSSLFSLYRILKCSYKLKMSTITDPFNGCPEFLNKIRSHALETPVFGVLPGFSRWQSDLTLSPRTFIMSSSASPSSKIA